MTSANAFAQTLRRYTSLNHLAQAARAVLQNTAQINQMLSDLNRVDFANVQVRHFRLCPLQFSLNLTLRVLVFLFNDCFFLKVLMQSTFNQSFL